MHFHNELNGILSAYVIVTIVEKFMKIPKKLIGDHEEGSA